MNKMLRPFLVRLLAFIFIGSAASASFLSCGPASEEELQTEDSVAVENKSDDTVVETGLKIVQVNPFYNGKYTGSDRSKVTWDTARRFAKLIKDIGRVGAIGMEEVSDPKVRDILAEVTGYDWEIKLVEQGINGRGSGCAVLWRTGLVELVEDLGYVEVERLDTNYTVRFSGVLLKRRAGSAPFGFFTGKFAWDGAELHGRTANDEDRAAEASKLRAWVQEKMAPYPDSPRIITMDMNGDYGSAVWRKMSEEYDDGGSTLPTFNSHSFWGLRQRLDYIWFDFDAGSKRSGGYIDGPRRSMHFGSDHRFVWAEVKVK